MFDREKTLIDPDEDNLFDEYLSSVAHAIRSSCHQIYGHSPSQSPFGRHMFINSKAKIDWGKIRESKEEKLNQKEFALYTCTCSIYTAIQPV